MTALSSLQEGGAYCAYVLFIGGTGIAFTTHPDLAGAGISSWIGTTYGLWAVHDGLEPPTLRDSIDFMSGKLEDNSVTFTIKDVDDVLLDLLATDRSDEQSILLQRIGPESTEDLSSVLTSEGAAQDLADKHIGLEHIGPASLGRPRNHFRPFPFASGNYGTGLDHPVNPNGSDLAPVVITDNPFVWEGRLVTVYRIFLDQPLSNHYGIVPSGTHHVVQNGNAVRVWKKWDPDDPPIWVGKLRGRGEVNNQTWRIKAYGWESLQKKLLNANTTAQWFPISTSLNLAGDRDQMAVVFRLEDGDLFGPVYYDSSIFNDGTHNVTESNSKHDVVDSINDAIQEVISSVNDNYSGLGGAADTHDSLSAGMDYDGAIWIRKAGAETATFFKMELTLHLRVWLALGYDPKVQNVGGAAPQTPYDVLFKSETKGERLFPGTQTVPQHGYYTGVFWTVRIGYEGVKYQHRDIMSNFGSRREFKPSFGGGISILDMENADQDVFLHGGGHPYIEPQYFRPSQNLQINGQTAHTNGSRLFLFHGQLRESLEDEPRDVYYVAKCIVRQSGVQFGVVADGTEDVIHTEEFIDPNVFGIDNPPAAFISSHDGLETAVRAAPILLLSTLPNTRQADWVHEVFTMLMLSSGTSTGWSGKETVVPPHPSIDEGDNGHGNTSALEFILGTDREVAFAGLAIPEELVAEPNEIKEAFEEATGDIHSAINRVKYVFPPGPVQAEDVLDSMLIPRRLAWRLYGRKFGLVKMASFPPSKVDETITADDLASPIPFSQDLKTGGRIDGIEIEHRQRLDGGTMPVWKQSSLDARARYADGKKPHKMTDVGLLSPAMFLNRPDKRTMQDVVGASPWFTAATQLWAREASEFHAKNHYTLKSVRLWPEKGRVCYVGTRVHVTSPHVVTPNGTRGITAAPGLILRHEQILSGEEYEVDILMFDGFGIVGVPLGPRFYSVIGMAESYDDGDPYVLTLTPDDRAPWRHDDTQVSETDGFDEPSWSSTGGDALIEFRSWDGVSFSAPWATAPVSFVSSADRTITLTEDLTGDTFAEHRDEDVVITMADYDTQSGAWPKAIYGFVVLETLKGGTVPTSGRPFH